MADPMSYERACEIVEACTALGVYHILGDRGRELRSLKDFSLAEMVEAQRVVKETEDARTKPGAGPQTYHTVCADRLVAALYVATHFPGDDPSNVNPICLLPDGRAVVVIQMSEAMQAAEGVGNHG